MILTHGANSLPRGVEFVEIGGRQYPTVKIGNLIWIAESLRYPTPNSYRPNGTDRYGLLYPYADFPIITSLLPNGWRLPTKADFEYLTNLCGTIGNGYISREFGGDNSTGFNAALVGYIAQNGEFLNYDKRGYIWTNSNHSDTRYMWNIWFQNSLIGIDDYSNKIGTKLQIRLTKDA